MVVENIRRNFEEPTLERAALVRADLLDEPNEQLAQKLIAEVPVTGQPVKITVAAAGVHVNHLRKAVRVPRFTSVNNSG
jgi:hypothetical protein